MVKQSDSDMKVKVIGEYWILVPAEELRWLLYRQDTAATLSLNYYERDTLITNILIIGRRVHWDSSSENGWLNRDPGLKIRNSDRN